MSLFPARKHAQKTLEHLSQLLPDNERDNPHVLLLAGATTPYRNDTDRELPFRQESNFFYLSACSVPSSFLLVTYSHPQLPTLDLFVPQAQAADLMWSVAPPSINEAKGMYDVTSVQHTEHLDAAIVQLLDKYPDALFHTLPRGSVLFPHLPDQYTQAVLGKDRAAVTDAYLLTALHRARLIKTEEEIELIRKACAVSSRAHEVVLSLLRMGRGKVTTTVGEEKPLLLPGEWLIESEGEAEAVFVASCRREGAIHQAYLPIVASSTRAATLHYCCNDKAFAWGPVEKGRTSVPLLEPQVLLIDAGCEWECYASDSKAIGFYSMPMLTDVVTRTIPVGNGNVFTAEARDIYKLVHEMQQVGVPFSMRSRCVPTIHSTR
jgi:Xaa-Pro dipeptidase